MSETTCNPPTFTYTPAAVLPVSLAELKDHLRLSGEDEDHDLEGKLSAAVRSIEDATGRVLISSAAMLNLEAWPRRDYIELPGGQTSAITAVKYTDSTGAVTTWAATNYKLVRGYSLDAPTRVIDGMARLQLAYGKSWPSVTLDTGEPIEITYQTGFKDADSVPWQLKAGVLIKAEVLYWRDPERSTRDTARDRRDRMNEGVNDLIAPFRIWTF